MSFFSRNRQKHLCISQQSAASSSISLFSKRSFNKCAMVSLIAEEKEINSKKASICKNVFNLGLTCQPSQRSAQLTEVLAFKEPGPKNDLNDCKHCVNGSAQWRVLHPVTVSGKT